MEHGYHVAIVGATGAVGLELLSILEERKFPVAQLSLLASKRSVGRQLVFAGAEFPVQELTEGSFLGVHFALFSVSASISKAFAPIAARAGAVVIDDSSAFRMDPEVPLVVTEVNPARLVSPSRHHRAPELLDHSAGDGPQSYPPTSSCHACRRGDVSIGFGGGGAGHAGARSADARPDRECTGRGQCLPPSDCLQLSAPHRCLRRHGVYRRGVEDGAREP